MALPTLDRTPTPAAFTRGVLTSLCLAVFVTLMRLPLVVSDLPRENALSVLGTFLPESLWANSLVVALAVSTFLIGILLWVWSPKATVGAVLAIAGLILIGSLRVENELYARHQLFQPVAVLGILGAGTALQRGKLAMPSWIWTAVAIAVGWGYTLSGFEKLNASGLSWADGTALRVWLAAFSPDNALAGWLVGTPWAAAIGQTTVLVAETTAVVGLAFRKTRMPFALVLLSFHLMTEWWMNVAFYANEVALLVLCATPFLAKGHDVSQ